MEISSSQINPRVSVVMSAYNAQQYLREAVESILNQTFTDFEFIIVDDGSTDNTAKILASYQDERIVRITHETNLGHARGLNHGIKIARGEYIARMDADDISEPERFTEQVRYLDLNQNVAVLSTWVKIIRDEVVTNEIRMVNATPAVLSWLLTWRCPIYHPSVMMRRDRVIKVGGYKEALLYAEDRNLWIQMMQAREVTTVLPKPLHQYRVWSNQIGTKHYIAQQQEGLQSSHHYVEWLLKRPVSLEQMKFMVSLYTGGELAAAEIHSGLALAYQISERCAQLFAQQGGHEVRNQVSDALIYAAADALKSGSKQQARSNLLTALRRHPLRAIRPQTFRLLAVSF